MPVDTATGIGTIKYQVGSNSFTAGIYIVASYLNLFTGTSGQAVGTVARLRGGQQVVESISTPIPMVSGEDVYLVLYGSGLGSANDVKATIGGVDATVAYAGPQGTWDGLDQYNVKVPASLVGKGRVEIVLSAGGHASNSVFVTLQ